MSAAAASGAADLAARDGLALADETPRKPSRWRLAAIVIGAWTAVGIFRAVERYVLDPTMRERLEFGFGEALAQNLVFSYLWAALTPLAVSLARRHPLPRARTLSGAAAHAAASLLLPLSHGFLFVLVYPAFMGVPLDLPARMRQMPELLEVFFLTNLVTYWGIVGITWTVESYRLSRERELRAAQLETQLADARLEALKMQLHPHFLFNALNSILPLVYRDRDAAARTVVQLGDLLRLSIQTEAHYEITLKEEIEFLELYLEIQKTRFQDRLSVALRIAPDLMAAQVPNLILQPLVENAIKHGVAARPGSGRVEVEGYREGPWLVLRVRDDGPGAPEGEELEKGGGVGLRNTRGRLQHLYEGRYRFDYGNLPEGGFAVTLAVPLALRAEEKSGPSDPMKRERGLLRAPVLPEGS